MEYCQFKKQGDDIKTWCLENPEQCLFKANLEERLWDNGVEFFALFFDMFKLMLKDDSCYTDMEVMGEMYRLFEDFGGLAANVYGYDLKWDQSIQRKHIKKNDFKKKMYKLYKSIPHKDVFKMEFPHLSKALKEFNHEMDVMLAPPKIQHRQRKPKPQYTFKKPVHHNSHQHQSFFDFLLPPAPKYTQSHKKHWLF